MRSAAACSCALLLTATALVARCAGRPSALNATAVVANDSSQPPEEDERMVIEVAPGETAVLQCPSNDEQHRFQYWSVKLDQIIGPGSALQSDKFKYEVLTGTLYIKKVTAKESGIYTCICKHLGNITLSARSVQLEIKKEWQDLWANDYTVNCIRVTAVLSVLVLLLLLVYLFYLTAYRNGNRTLHFREDYSDRDVSMDRQMYKKTNIMKSENMFQQGIDNPTLENDIPSSKQ